jgi:hypothetical protein
MMGSEEQNVPICFTTLPACARRLRTLNEIALPIVPLGTTPSARADSNSSWIPLPFMRSRRSSSRRPRRRRFLSRAGTRHHRPTSYEDGREFAGDRDPGSRQAATLGDLHAPGAQARPFLAANQQRMRGLIKSRARQFVAASTDPHLDIRFARLIASRGQTQVSADISRQGGPAPPEKLEMMHIAWSAAAAQVVGVFFGDPMGPEASTFHAIELQRAVLFHGRKRPHPGLAAT